MREKGTMKGTKKAGIECRGMDIRKRHTKETYERDGTEMSVMRTRCERFRPGKVESRKPKDTQKKRPEMSLFFVVPTGISLASSS